MGARYACARSMLGAAVIGVFVCGAEATQAQSMYDVESWRQFGNQMQTILDQKREEDEARERVRERQRQERQDKANLDAELSKYSYCFCSVHVFSESLPKAGYKSSVYLHSPVAHISNRRNCYFDPQFYVDQTKNSCKDYSAYLSECKRRILDTVPRLMRHIESDDISGYCADEVEAGYRLKEELARISDET